MMLPSGHERNVAARGQAKVGTLDKSGAGNRDAT
jgi:hypothetical protein